MYEQQKTLDKIIDQMSAAIFKLSVLNEFHCHCVAAITHAHIHTTHERFGKCETSALSHTHTHRHALAAHSL